MGWILKTQHEKNAEFKQQQRRDRIAALKAYNEPLTSPERNIIDQSVCDLVQKVRSKSLHPRDILLAFGKQALIAHEKTNCLTEVMITDAEKWADAVDPEAPLSGIPVSLKDPFAVKGYDTLAGYSRFVNQPATEDSAIARILKDAGAVPFVKTNNPITMMAIEGYNDVWGRTLNWHNPNYAPGGSSQGEGALIAAGGSRIGVGTDIGGSVRVPAAWSGIFSLKFSNWRWPVLGDRMMVGFEGIVSNASPLAKTLPDLRYFIESVMEMQPWKYDYELIPLPWRRSIELPSRPKVGVLVLEKYLPPTPAQQRALNETVAALRTFGCDVVDFELPSAPETYDSTIARLHHADGYRHVLAPMMFGEHNDPYVAQVMRYSWLPGWVRSLWQGLLRLLGLRGSAERYADRGACSSREFIELVAKREQLRKQFHEYWDSLGVDFVVCPPHPSPALPNGAPDSSGAILYTSLFNLLDFPAGILPVGVVDSKKDALPAAAFNWSLLTPASRLTFSTYDSERMAGLPTAVQVVCKRYEEEKTLKAMEFTYAAIQPTAVP